MLVMRTNRQRIKQREILEDECHGFSHLSVFCLFLVVFCAAIFLEVFKTCLEVLLELMLADDTV